MTRELPPATFGQLSDGTYDEVEGADRALVVKPGATPGDPGSLGLGTVGSMAAVRMVTSVDARPNAVAVYWVSIGLDGVAPYLANVGDQLYVEE